jgi:hypothetical protein
MTALDNIGIKLDDGTLQWTTIVSVDSTTTLTITAALTGNAATGNNVFTFTNRVDRPLSIMSARFRSTSGVERPLEIMGRTAFMNLPNKAMTGKCNQIYYSPKVSTATLYTWPVCDDVGDCIAFSYLRRIQDFDSSSNNPDVPQEWLEAITYNLAIRLSGPCGIDVMKRDPDIKEIAVRSLMEMQLWDAEESSVSIVPRERFDD